MFYQFLGLFIRVPLPLLFGCCVLTLLWKAPGECFDEIVPLVEKSAQYCKLRSFSDPCKLRHTCDLRDRFVDLTWFYRYNRIRTLLTCRVKDPITVTVKIDSDIVV